MKTHRTLFLPLFCLVCRVLPAAEAEQPVPSKVASAKVYLQGAQVERSARLTLGAGHSTLVLTGLPQGLDPQSVQVTGKGAWSMLSVNHRINYLSETADKKEVEDLQVRIKAKEHELNAEANAKAVWDQEEQLLQKNLSVAGQQNGVTVGQLQAVNEYVRARLAAVKAGQLVQTEKLTAIGEELGKMRQQLQQMQAQGARPTSEVVLEVEAAAAVQASLRIAYFVHQASWTPAYDLRAMGTDQPISLSMKAQVVNGTGEDWDQVELSLSSGNPTLGGVMPTLQPWILAQPWQPVPVRGARLNEMSKAEGAAPMPQADGMDMDAMDVVATTVQQRTTTWEYGVDAPFTIPADGASHTVRIKEHQLTADYRYACTPKLDRDAFLYARTTGWEDLDLMPGEANVFFEGSYVGKSYLALDRPEDTLQVSLGRDKGIVVDRVKRKPRNDKSLVGGKRTVEVGWDISVRNTKGVPVELDLLDQWPLSPRSEVEVKLEESGGAVTDPQTGRMTWKLSLAPKETRKLAFRYTVKYPKDQPVVVE